MPTYVVKCLHRETSRPYMMLVEARDPRHAVDLAARASHVVSTSRPMSLSAFARRNHRPKYDPEQDPEVQAYFASVRRSQRWGCLSAFALLATLSGTLVAMVLVLSPV